MSAEVVPSEIQAEHCIMVASLLAGGTGTQHFLNIRKFKRDSKRVLVRSIVATIRSIVTAYGRHTRATVNRALTEVQCL